MVANGAASARAGLMVLLASLLLCVAATYVLPAGTFELNSASLAAIRPGSTPANESERLLSELQHRAMTAAESRRIVKLVDHPDWPIAAAAVRTLGDHGHAKHPAMHRRFLQRASRLLEAGPAAAQSQQEWTECVAASLAAMDRHLATAAAYSSEPASHDNHPDLGPLWSSLAVKARDGRVRAKALLLSAQQSPHDLQQTVLAAMTDPSEQVCLTALDLVAQHRWQAPAAAVNQLASSARPNLRRRAGQVQVILGSAEPPREYGECAIRTILRLADRFEELGINPADRRIVTPSASDPGNATRITAQALSRSAESFLDGALTDAKKSDDGIGVLYMLAAARIGQRKLAVRLWEYAVTQSDSDDELFELGLVAIARAQLLEALIACNKKHDQTSLQAVSILTRLTRLADRHPSLQRYVEPSALVSAALLRHGDPESTLDRRQDSMQPLIAFVLEAIDPARPEHYQEAQRRLEQWCASGGPIPSHRRQRPVQTLAN